MNHPPRITVIIPSLDQELYLERAICSVLDQGYDNLELIVMDGGSEDNSLEIIRQYDNDIDHWQSTWDSGPAEAINTALSWATGEIVGILDADDAYLPYALHEAAKASGAGRADWFVGQSIRVDELDDHLDDLPADPPRSLAAFLMQEDGPLAGSAVFYRTELVKSMGGFDSTLKLAYGQEMHARLYAAQQVPGVIRAAVAAVREHELSLSATQGLACGGEFIEAAERYSTHLAPTHRYLLWRTCDESRRIFNNAGEAIEADPAQRTIWQQLLRKPWWLSSSDYRRRLLQHTGETTPYSADPTHQPDAFDAGSDERRAA
ncbi:MAG: glycosyltransferase [Planctomycetota bacterium]